MYFDLSFKLFIVYLFMFVLIIFWLLLLFVVGVLVCLVLIIFGLIFKVLKDLMVFIKLFFCFGVVNGKFIEELLFVCFLGMLFRCNVIFLGLFLLGIKLVLILLELSNDMVVVCKFNKLIKDWNCILYKFIFIFIDFIINMLVVGMFYLFLWLENLLKNWVCFVLKCCCLWIYVM